MNYDWFLTKHTIVFTYKIVQIYRFSFQILHSIPNIFLFFRKKYSTNRVDNWITACLITACERIPETYFF